MIGWNNNACDIIIDSSSMQQDCHHSTPNPLTSFPDTLTIAKYESEDEQDHRIHSPLLYKTYSVGSTIDSPHKPSQKPTIFNFLQIDSSLQSEMDWEMGEKCSEFYVRGVCMKATQCAWEHHQIISQKRARKMEMVANFPQLVGVGGLGRCQSFLK